MVNKSPIAQSTIVTIDRDGLKFRPGSILSGLTITWGRSSLFDPPQKRTLSMRILLENSDFQDQARWILGKSVSVEISGEIAFVGYIDNVRVVGSPATGQDQWLLAVQAVEATGWNEHLSRTFTTRIVNTFLLRKSLESQAPKSIPKLIGAPTNTMADSERYEFDEASKLEVKKGWELLIMSGVPGVFGNWSPDYRTLSRTIDTLEMDWDKMAVVPANAVVMDSPHWEARDFPGSIKFTSGGLNSKVREHKTITRGGTRTGNEIVMNFPAVLSNERDFSDRVLDDLVALISAQATSPRNFEFMDTAIKSDSFRKVIFTTTEKPNRIAIQDGWYDKSTLGVDPYYYVIGGTLTIKPNMSTHSTTCIYSERTVKQNLSRPWMAFGEQWQHTAGEWKDS